MERNGRGRTERISADWRILDGKIVVKLRCGAEQNNRVHIQQPVLFREFIMVLLFLPAFLQCRLTNWGTLTLYCIIIIVRLSRCLRRQSFPKPHIKFRRRRNTQMKEFNIQNTVEVWKQELKNTSKESPKEHVNSSQPNSVSNKKASCEIEFRYEKDANWNSVCFKCHQTTVSLCFIKPTERRLLKLKLYYIPVIFNCAKFKTETPGDTRSNGAYKIFIYFMAIRSVQENNVLEKTQFTTSKVQNTQTYDYH